MNLKCVTRECAKNDSLTELFYLTKMTRKMLPDHVRHYYMYGLELDKAALLQRKPRNVVEGERRYRQEL